MTEITITAPHVPFGPQEVPALLADADYLDHAARNISGGYEVGGHNVTMTVVNLLHSVATALRERHEAEVKQVACPHWEPGRITMRRGCTACEAETLNHEKGGQ